MRTRTLSACLSLLALTVAACSSSSSTTTDAPAGHGGSDAFVPQDAPAGPFGCLGQPVPTRAPDPLTLSGSAETLDGTSVAVAPGVAITALDSSGTTLATATTDSHGAYALSFASGGSAVDVHVTASKSGDRDSALYPATALYADSASGFVIIITQTDFDFLADASSETQDPDKGAVGAIVVDCDGSAITGATVATDPPGDVVYLDGGTPSSSASATDSTGVALIFNVPAGAATLSASAGGMTLRSHAITAAAGVTTTAAIRP